MKKKLNERMSLKKGFMLTVLIYVTALTACGSKSNDVSDDAVHEPVFKSVPKQEFVELSPAVGVEPIELSMEVEAGIVYDAEGQEITEMKAGEDYTFNFQIRNTTPFPVDLNRYHEACLIDVLYDFEMPMTVSAGRDETIRVSVLSFVQDVNDVCASWEMSVAEDMIIEPVGSYVGLYNGDIPVEAEISEQVWMLNAGETVDVTCTVATFSPEEWREKSKEILQDE